MKVEIKSNNNWLEVKQLAFRTIGKETELEPTSEWKTRILLSQHSPIRSLVLTITMKDIPYWVSVHLSRHKYGCEHYVQTQRTDRTGMNRDELPQGTLVTHTIVANAESLINISRKRLCRQASKETRELWEEVVRQITLVEPELGSILVPDCVYRNELCTEFKPCKWNKSKEFTERYVKYMETIIDSQEE